MSGTGTARIGKAGRLRGKIQIKDGDDSTFVAERADAPSEPIEEPPSYRNKWRRRYRKGSPASRKIGVDSEREV